MRILVIGSGGREHTLVWKLAQSPHATQLWCAPGNAGMAQEHLAGNGAAVECVNLGAEDLPKLLAFALEKKVDLTVVGPDNPLALGIVDLFQQNRLRIWGCNQKGAQFESSKVFSQNFMNRYGIPTAAAGTFTNPVAAKQFAATLGGRCAVKADGLALGKGVLICTNEAEANRAIDEILVAKAFGAAGANIVIQEFLEGVEVSLHALCDGKTAKLFPTSQDHKRALDGDRGLNTGGMGTYSPTPFLNDAELQQVGDQILQPWLRGCREEEIDFHGILYPGVMLTKAGAKVLEFNARFGDPETQVYLTRLENDLVELLDASVSGTLAGIEMKWNRLASVCVVLASGGYPGSYAKGKVIAGLDEANALPATKVFHAGTAKSGHDIVTSGGRVLGVTALGEGVAGAVQRAYAAVARIRFDGMQYRRDIAARVAGHDMKKLIFTFAIGLAALSVQAQSNATDLGPTTELIGLLKSHFVDSDQLDAKRLTDATVGGLLQALGEGVQILTTAQAASNTVSRSMPAVREPLARTEVIQPDIAYIRLADVTEATPAALDGELKKFLAAKVTGFVLDLRFADGTNYAAAATVASRFISGEPDLFFVKANGQCQELFRASEPSRILTVEPSDAPVMVLVNSDTRGAAEAVAAALRAQERAIIIGSRTAGQAIAWRDVPLSDGRVLRVATTKIAIAGGKDIFPGGVTPDIAVKIDEQTEREAVINAATNITLTASLQPTETKKAIREADLLKFFRGEALEAPPLTLGTNAPNIETAATNGLTAAAIIAPPPAPRREVRDTVLQRAVDILKGIRVLLSSR